MFHSVMYLVHSYIIHVATIMILFLYGVLECMNLQLPTYIYISLK